MLQMSQIEKPRCSATIDQIRFRRAIALPSAFQNFSSSGFQSEIHRPLGLLIADVLSQKPRLHPAFTSAEKQKPLPEALAAAPQGSGVAIGPSLDQRAALTPSAFGRLLSSFVPALPRWRFLDQDHGVARKMPNLNEPFHRRDSAHPVFKSRTYCAAQKIGSGCSALGGPRREMGRDV